MIRCLTEIYIGMLQTQCGLFELSNILRKQIIKAEKAWRKIIVVFEVIRKKINEKITCHRWDYIFNTFYGALPVGAFG